MASLPFELKGKTVYVAGHRGMAAVLMMNLLRTLVGTAFVNRGQGQVDAA